ncbi:phage tail protein [Listeria monocytogenes]|nr:phage tail protein [Listeria monocytogenes]
MVDAIAFPVLYKADDADLLAGLVPQNNGVGVLTNISNAVVTEEKQGAFTFTFNYHAANEFDEDYDLQKVIFDNLEKRAVVKVKVNDFDGEKLFRIDESDFDVTSEIKTITAIAIGQYDLAANSFVYVSKKGATPAVALNAILDTAVVANNYTAWSDVTTTGNFSLEYKTIAEAIAGTEGSIIDTWRTELEWDNFTIKLHKNRGANRGVRIEYAKNLLGLNETTTGDVVTRIIPFANIDDGSGGQLKIALKEVTVDAENVSDNEIALALPVDFSQEMMDRGYTTEAHLRSLATNYFKSTSANIPKVSLDVDFVQLSKTEEYEEYAVLEHVALCDTVTIWHERYNKNIEATVNKYTYNPVDELYLSLELGDAKYSLNSKAESDAKSNAALTDKIDGTYDFIQLAIDKATDLITGNDGGYVLLYPPKRPAEIFVMDTADVNTAQQVLRLNKSGIGFSSTGINGEYKTAWTLDGAFNANFITSGTITAVNLKGVNITGSTGYFDTLYSSFLPGLPSPQYREELQMGGGAGFHLTAQSVSKPHPALQIRMNTNGDLGLAIEAINENTGAVHGDKVVRLSPFAGIETPLIQSDGWCCIGANPDGKTASIDRYTWVSGGGPQLRYVPHRASNFETASSEEYKTNIRKVKTKAFGKTAKQVVTETDVFTYSHIADETNELKIGFIAEQASESLTTADGKAIDLYNSVAWLYQYAKENEAEKEELRAEVAELKTLVNKLIEQVSEVNK